MKGQGQRLKVKVRISKIKFYVYLKYPVTKWDDIWYDGVKKVDTLQFQLNVYTKGQGHSQNMCIKIMICLYLRDG